MPEHVDTLAEWLRLVAARDISSLDAILSDGVVFYSPVVHTPQIGKARTLPYLTAAFHVFLNDSFRYVRDVAGERNAVLEFEVEVDGVLINGVDMLEWNADGKLVEFKVMIRPLKAVNLIHEKMKAMLSTFHKT